MNKFWLWASLVLMCLLIASTVLLIKSLRTPGKAAWVIMKSKDSTYHPTVLTVPTPKLPSPNGFDTFVQAGKLLKDTDRVADALGVNATISPAAMQQLIDENTAALALFRTGLSQQYLHPPIRSLDTKLPYSKWRQIGRLLALSAHAKAAQGDWAGAAQYSLDAIQLGATIPHGGILITSLVGIAIQELGYRELWPCVNHLSAPQAQEVLQRLAHIAATQESCATILQDEMYSTYASVKAKVIDNNSNAELRRMHEIVLGLYVQNMQRTISNVRIPYAKQPPSPTPNGIDAEIMLPDQKAVSAKETGNQVDEELLLLALALRAFAVEHTHYPTSLNELAPTYLAQVPGDPFSLHASYRYKPQGTSYLLYSIGPDGQDNGGHPFSKPAGVHGTPASSISAKSIGDIVAPVN